MSKTPMYSLLKALTEVEEAFKNKENSVTLRNIQFACARRVAELFDKKVDLSLFTDHVKNQPCATFTFLQC